MSESGILFVIISELLLESYSHNNEEVTLHCELKRVEGNDRFSEGMAEPITLMKQIQLPDFDMIQFDTKRVAVLYPNGFLEEIE